MKVMGDRESLALNEVASVRDQWGKAISEIKARIEDQNSQLFNIVSSISHDLNEIAVYSEAMGNPIGEQPTFMDICSKAISEGEENTSPLRDAGQRNEEVTSRPMPRGRAHRGIDHF